MSFVSFKPGGFGGNASADNMRPRGVFDKSSTGMAGGADTFANNLLSMMVSRPVSGIRIKERSPATLMVLRSNGKPIPILSSTGGPWDVEEGSNDFSSISGGVETIANYASGKTKVSKYYTDFSLVKVEENRAEKIQIAQTFGEDFIFMYGERPRMLSCTGVLVNTQDFTWRARFWDNYDKYLRGTRLVEQGARAYLSWDDVMAEGYMLSASALDLANEPHAIQFSFILLITNYVNLGQIRGSLLEGLADIYQGVQDASNMLTLSMEKQGKLGPRGGLLGDKVTSFLGHTFLGEQLEYRQIDSNMKGKDTAADGTATTTGALAVKKAALKRREAGESKRVTQAGSGPPPAQKPGVGPAAAKTMFVDKGDSATTNHQTDGLADQANTKKMWGSDHKNIASMSKINLPKS